MSDQTNNPKSPAPEPSKGRELILDILHENPNMPPSNPGAAVKVKIERVDRGFRVVIPDARCM